MFKKKTKVAEVATVAEPEERKVIKTDISKKFGNLDCTVSFSNDSLEYVCLYSGVYYGGGTVSAEDYPDYLKLVDWVKATVEEWDREHGGEAVESL